MQVPGGGGPMLERSAGQTSSTILIPPVKHDPARVVPEGVNMQRVAIPIVGTEGVPKTSAEGAKAEARGKAFPHH